MKRVLFIAAIVIAALSMLTACGKTRQLTEVVINADNWEEYFEIIECPKWRKTPFDETEGLSITWAVRLKEEYQALMKEWEPGQLPAPDEKYSYVVFEFQADCELVGFEFDTEARQYSYGEKIADDGLQKEKSIVEWAEYSEDFCEDVFWGQYSTDTVDGVEVKSITKYENISVLRVEGSIYLLEEN